MWQIRVGISVWTWQTRKGCGQRRDFTEESLAMLASCYGRDRNYISARIVVDSFSGYSPDTDKWIKFSNRCCRLQPRPLHDKVVVVTLVLRSRCAPTPLRADARPRRLFWTSSKTIGEVWRSVRIFQSMSSSITFPTRLLHEVHVQSTLRQCFVPFWPKYSGSWGDLLDGLYVHLSDNRTGDHNVDLTNFKKIV